MTSALTCAAALTQLSAVLDGVVAPEVAADLDAHLVGCPACRERFDREIRFAGMVAHALRGSADQAGDEASWAHALEGATAIAPAAGSGVHLWWDRFRRAPTPRALRWVALVASLALLATFSMAGLGLRHSSHVSAPPTSGAQPAPPGSAH